MTLNYYDLKYQYDSLDKFCEKYAELIEGMIELSHNGKCPKIQANYDDF